jgi:3-hydroxyisobutyrate dehydrogenase
MVGANSKEDYELASIVLEGMGKKIFHCGGPGTGEIAKICNNMILGIQMVACSEGMVLGEKLGIDPKVLHQILSVSTSNCWCINSANPRPGNIETAPSSRNYEGGF